MPKHFLVTLFGQQFKDYTFSYLVFGAGYCKKTGGPQSSVTRVSEVNDQSLFNRVVNFIAPQATLSTRNILKYLKDNLKNARRVMKYFSTKNKLC